MWHIGAALKEGVRSIRTRKAAKRTINELWSTIGCLLDQLAADECERYIRHANYGKLPRK
jgi:hypothetical protein